MPHAFGETPRSARNPRAASSGSDNISLGPRRRPLPRREGVPCVLCGEVAWYLVGRRAWCEAHRAEARAAARRQVSEKWV